MPARHCACSAHLVTSARSAPPCLGVLQLQDEPTYGLTGKKQGRGTGLSHMSCENRAKPCKLFVSCKKTCKLFVSCKLFHMQKPCKTVQAVPHAKTAQNRASCSCHAKKRAKPCKLFVSCKKTCKLFHMQKPCKTVQAVRVMQKNAQAVPHAKTMQKPCKMRRVRSANPLNIHSPPGPCYMCYMCYMALYSTYSTDFARTEYIVHIVHIARSWGRVEVQRLGAASMPSRWRGRN